MNQQVDKVIGLHKTPADWKRNISKTLITVKEQRMLRLMVNYIYEIQYLKVRKLRLIGKVYKSLLYNTYILK